MNLEFMYEIEENVFSRTVELKFKKLCNEAIPFKYNYETDSCMDVHSLEEAHIFPGQTRIIKTGIAVELPKGFEGVIRGRSGLSSRGILVHQGIIDEEYRGDIGVIITNLLDDGRNFVIKPGDRIAQFSIHPVYKIDLLEMNELSNTVRGTNGYGSSGV